MVCQRSRHVVSCATAVNSPSVSSVCLDYRATGAMGAQHLMECGLRVFSYYGIPTQNASVLRFQSFSEQIINHGLSFIPCPAAFIGLDGQAQSPWTELTDWLKTVPKPIGIMAFDDAAGYYLAAACRHANVNVPEQIAILGVNNDTLMCEIASPPLSSVEAGFSRVGFAAARLLDRLLRGEKLDEHEKHLVIQPLGIVKRLSTDLLAVNDPQLSEAIRFIRENACNPCSVDDVAQVLAISRRSLEQRFVKVLGRTPGEEIMRIRMDTAKRLLRQREISLREVAKLCGFSGDSTLVRAFHHVEGTTPLAYRRAAQSSR